MRKGMGHQHIVRGIFILCAQRLPLDYKLSRFHRNNNDIWKDSWLINFSCWDMHDLEFGISVLFLWKGTKRSNPDQETKFNNFKHNAFPVAYYSNDSNCPCKQSFEIDTLPFMESFVVNFVFCKRQLFELLSRHFYFVWCNTAFIPLN